MEGVCEDEEEAQSENKAGLTQTHVKAERRGSVSSCESLKSDRSMGPPILFSPEDGPAQSLQAESHKHRAGSSCESLKSDWSMGPPILFSPEAGPAQSLQAESHKHRAGSSCESLKSDWSMGPPILFSPEAGPAQSLQESPDPAPPSCHLWGGALKSSVSSSCGHGFCKGCSSSSQNQSYSAQSCPQCGPRALYRAYRSSLEQRCDSVSEGTETGHRTPLNRIYTELYITEGLSEEVRTQHEERQMETGSKKLDHDTPIRCQDVFKRSPSDQKTIRAVLTCGVAGVGKTFSVLKFCLDWAQGSENQEMELVLPLSFRELNLVREQHYSLLTLIQVFHPSLKELSAQTLAHSKVLFICDGLDESRLSLDFSCEVISEVTQETEVGHLLVNLIRGSLLPHALIWITSRPAAANQIPAWCVHRVTEVRGFITDQQKEQYFRKRVTDSELCDRVLSHIRTSRSLLNMCQLPVFCWITSCVLDHMLRSEQSGPLPQTLSDMFAHFLLVQTQRKWKYSQESRGPELTPADCELLLKLGRLAFEHLQRGNIMFYQEDLEQVGLDLTEASVYSGLCTEIFKQESVLFNKSVYCFIHLSVQEFLAAIFHIHMFNKESNNKKMNKQPKGKTSKGNTTMEAFLKKTLTASFQSPNGHLDLFVRFLHGLSLESNQRLLRALLGPSQTDSGTKERVISNLKEMNTKKISPDRSINIFHCLMELQDLSLHQQIQDFLKSDRSQELSESQCSALAYMLQMSKEVLETLELKKFKASAEGQHRLIPAVRNCRQAQFSGCNISKVHLEVVASALKTSPSHLRLLDLSSNSVMNSEMKVLSDGLQSPNCRLETLSLHSCSLSESGCSSLGSALRSNPSHLRRLDLSSNKDLRDSGVERLCGFLQSPDCRLETLSLHSCSLSESGCSSLGSALRSNPSHLRELNLSLNKDLKDSGVERLCGFLQSPDCRLETLSLCGCGLSESGCSSLASALRSGPSALRSDPSALRSDPSALGSDPSALRSDPSALRSDPSALRSDPSALRSDPSALRSDPSALGSDPSALRSDPPALKRLDLGSNPDLKDSGVEHLCGFLQSPDCRLETLRLNGCSLSRSSCSSLASALRANPSHLRELTLGDNRVKAADVQELLDLQQSRHCRLEDLRWAFHLSR